MPHGQSFTLHAPQEAMLWAAESVVLGPLGPARLPAPQRSELEAQALRWPAIGADFPTSISVPALAVLCNPLLGETEVRVLCSSTCS